MTDPLPQKAPDSSYNTNPRPRSRKRFKFLAAPKDLEGYYSPFWPLLVVFMAFIILLIYEISFLRSRAMSMRMQVSHLADGVQKASGQATFIQGLHSDLAGLAPTHPAAALLLKEFFPPETAAPSAPDDASNPPSPTNAPSAKPPGAETAPLPAAAPPHP